MLIKTHEFDTVFLHDLSEITLFKPPVIVGSYKIKPYGALITDIDMKQFIHISESFLQRLNQVIKTAKSFQFLGITCGTYPELTVPWIIDGEGSCSYDDKKTQIWLQSIQKILPKEIYTEIHSILSKKRLSISQLVKVRSILGPYSRIKWSAQDLLLGYKKFLNKKYSFLDMMKKGHTTTAKFLYKYTTNNETEVCLVDCSFEDKNYIAFPSILTQYYEENYYKIFKSYKWYIKPEYFQQFIKAMNELEKYTSLRSRLELLSTTQKILPSKLVEKIKTDIENYARGNKIKINKLEKKISKLSKKYILYFRHKIKEQYKEAISLYEIRADQSKEKMPKKGKLKIPDGACPFFEIQLPNLKFLIDIALRAQISEKKLIDCVKLVSSENEIPIEMVINDVFSKNKGRIIKINEEIFLQDKGKLEKIKNPEELITRQKEILIGKSFNGQEL